MTAAERSELKTLCGAYLWPYVEKIKTNAVNHCAEQDQMIDNVLLPVLRRPDVCVDDNAICDGLKLQKYFPYQLIPWEIFLFGVIVGIKFVRSRKIYFTEIRAIVGRGAGKNGFLSFLCFYFLSPYHGIRHYDIDLLANGEEQAKVSFRDVFQVITDPEDKASARALERHYHATLTEIEGTVTHSVLRYNTSSKRGKDSKRTGCLMLDEVHEYLTWDNINTLKSGLGKRANGRIISITTDGHVRGGVLDRQKEQNKKILSQYTPDNRVFVFWCRIEAEREWKDPDCWIKANPSLDDFPDLRETIRKEVQDMPYNMEYYPEFMAKRMNWPVGNKDIEVASWDDILATNQPVPDLTGKQCVGGLDYARTNDFVGCFLRFRIGKISYCIQKTFVCKQSRDLPGIKAPIQEWADRGDVEIVDEPEIPPEKVAGWFGEMNRKYRIRMIAIDSYRYALMKYELEKAGFDSKYRKNIWLVRPSDIERIFPLINSAFVSHQIAVGDCPVFRWAANNTKKEVSGKNYTYGKIEPHYRKTDTFMAFVATWAVDDYLPTETEAGSAEYAVLAPVIL